MRAMLRALVLDLLDLLFAIVLAALVLAVLLWLCGRVSGAPVPPPPKALSAELLAGRWAYRYGGHAGGAIWFDADGHYTAQHEPGAPQVYFGRWWVECGTTVVLLESSYNGEFGVTGGPQVYRFEFALGEYPRLSGTSNGATPVVLTNRVRTDER